MENLINKMELEEMDLYIEGQEYEENVTGEKFKINNLGSANWAFRKLKAIKDKEKEVQELYQAELDRIKEWKDRELKQFKNTKEFFEGLLMEYFIEQKKVDPKFKISTPYGKVTSRKQQPKWHYEDEKTIDWLRKNDAELIRIKEEVDKSNLKKKYQIAGNQVVTEDGEIVEGIAIEERNESISIKVVE